MHQKKGEYKENRKAGMSVEEAINKAVNDCIKENVLKEFFTAHKAEVMHMLLTEYDEAEVMEMFRRDAYEAGIENINALNQKLISENRIDDMKRATVDKAYQDKLIKEMSVGVPK